MNALAVQFPDRRSLERLLAQFRQVRVAVLGDYFLDRYLVIDPRLNEPSLETGLTARQVVAVRNSPGAAGTVVNNLVALGAGSLHALGVIGDDGYGFELRRELNRRSVDTSRLIGSSERCTPVYTKPVLREGNAEREIERLDIVNRTAMPSAIEDRILEHLDAVAGQVDAVIILDQVTHADFGVVTRRVRDALADVARRNRHTLFYADSRAFIEKFTDVVVKVNHDELVRSKGTDSIPTEVAVREVSRTFQARTGKPVFTTMGPRGILVTTSDKQELLPGIPVSGPIDVTGAGDSATAAIVLGMCAGADEFQAAMLGNLVASITIQRLGTTGTASPDEVLDRHEMSLRSLRP